MSGYAYTCDRARKALVEMVRLTEEVGLLQVPLDPGILHQCVIPCDPCRRDKEPKRCCGWQTVVERGILSFGPITFARDRKIRLGLSTRCSYQRPGPGRQPKWDEAPLAASVVALEIFDFETEELIERHHLDLANRTSGEPGQPGPVWHLQVGGNPAGDATDPPSSWLTLPRWPIPPMDLTLAVELVAYTFFPAEWEKLNGNGGWLRLVKLSEQLVVSHFAKHMADHFNRQLDQRDRTWLAAQDNENGSFDPRPHAATGGT